MQENMWTADGNYDPDFPDSFHGHKNGVLDFFFRQSFFFSRVFWCSHQMASAYFSFHSVMN